MDVMHDPVGDSNLGTALFIASTDDPHKGLRTFNAEFIAHARQDVPYLLDALGEVLKDYYEKQQELQQSQGRKRVLRDALEELIGDVIMETGLLECAYEKQPNSAAMSAMNHLHVAVKQAEKALTHESKS